MPNPTQQTKERTFNFASGNPVYQLHDDATEIDIQDQLTARLAQLNSMLNLVTGASFSSFSNHSDKIQMDYLWSCSMLAQECQELASMQTVRGGESHA